MGSIKRQDNNINTVRNFNLSARILVLFGSINDADSVNNLIEDRNNKGKIN